jgi:hypothetical protein
MKLNQKVARRTPRKPIYQIVSKGRKKKNQSGELEKSESRQIQSQIEKMYVRVRLQGTREVGWRKQQSDKK